MSKGRHAKPMPKVQLPELDMSNPKVYWPTIISVVIGSILLVWAFFWTVLS